MASTETRSKTRGRMTGTQRREQLISVARGIFADKGLEATTVEEIAKVADVSKPVVYEHFGGKEGLYAVLVDREITTFSSMVKDGLDTPGAGPRQLLEQATLSMLTYIDQFPDGFKILLQASPDDSPDGYVGTILDDITDWVADHLRLALARLGFDPSFAGLYAQAMVGLVSDAARYWLANRRQFTLDEVAAHLVNLLWNGLGNLQKEPVLLTRESPRWNEKRRRRAAKAAGVAAKKQIRYDHDSETVEQTRVLDESLAQQMSSSDGPVGETDTGD